MADLPVTIVGAGLAGSEAALLLSRAGVEVDLYEMRPGKLTPAHRSGRFAELVCSNSLGSGELTSGKGLLKEELRILGSALLPIAEASRVPAGKALAVDREEFGRRVTEAVRSCPGIRVHEEEVKTIPGDPLVILACGPLASDAIASAIRADLGDDGFYFYDAISPIVDAETIDPEASFVADRYGVGTGDYLNLPMDRERYEAFLSALLTAKTVALRAFEEPRYFEGCMPVEEIARRGPDTLLFGPLRPVGLRDPRTGKIPHAVVQLRKENAEGTMYNLVGFQTRMTYPEQRRVFSLIPGLSSAGYFRYGSVHRNSFLDARRHLHPWMESRTREGLFFAGQITGVEGYVESIASGLVAAISAGRRESGKDPRPLPRESMIGALMERITTPGTDRPQPMNSNFGLLPEVAVRRKRDRKERKAEVALAAIRSFIGELP
ncbi:methylenetetrahydrofolate--tRNA-(uracil(54)-C(5))-methyltransferase (FADH(2)-oxidizing) TrmFO [Candidatus Deferrimicrobium sp.]|uniref:methylenetetrahydrofolate--tRNA-(uracil(54)- C(5))-methyltransferase (FADH(2)-oxidizing) TrmFO n=1 Tax=Candidatus Deferrimicrobium sp. TaxID=3060586 RepID=UPI002EDA27C0